MVKGIPYFGENTQEIYEDILNTDYEQVPLEEYESLYNFIDSHINNKIVVVINNEWISWLNDIVFNYRDKKCYLPYFTYEYFCFNDKEYKLNNKGHLILRAGELWIRYNYALEKMSINLNTELSCYNIESGKAFRVKCNRWITDNAVDLDKLYTLYVESSYTQDDYIVNKHLGGYHYITLSGRGVENKEARMRKWAELNTFKHELIKDEYRDVRQYTYEEVLQKYGLIQNIEPYVKRRLRFESYLYCCIQEGLLDNIKFTNNIYKLGRNIKLIIKDYWLLNNGASIPDKTWMK